MRVNRAIGWEGRDGVRSAAGVRSPHRSKTPGSLTAGARWGLLDTPTPAAPTSLRRETGDTQPGVAAGWHLRPRPRPAPLSRRGPRGCHRAVTARLRLLPIHPIPSHPIPLRCSPRCRAGRRPSGPGLRWGSRGCPCPRGILRERGDNGTRRGNFSCPPQRRGLLGAGALLGHRGWGKGLRSEGLELNESERTPRGWVGIHLGV